jgi:hypothetical protein
MYGFLLLFQILKSQRTTTEMKISLTKSIAINDTNDKKKNLEE